MTAHPTDHPDTLTADRVEPQAIRELFEVGGKILLIRPSALGDVCRTVPLLVSLKRGFPRCAIDWLVQDGFADAVAGHPDLNGVVRFPRGLFKRWYVPMGTWRAGRWLQSLAKPGYDLVIDAQGLARSGLLAMATRARIRVGPADAREMGWVGYTHTVRPAPGVAHTVDRMLALVAALGVPIVRDLTLHPSPPDLERADELLRPAGKRVLLLAPTSRWPGKQWPADRFAAAAEALLASGGGGFDGAVIVGSEKERAQCAPLIALAQRDRRVVDAMGRTSVGGLLALVARSAVVIANDSAALHMAVGCAKPLVALFGPTDVAKVGPYGRSADVIQHVGPEDRLDHKDEAGGRALMERISVDEVIERARDQGKRGQG